MAYLTIVQAAKQFNVTRSRIYRAIENGNITPHIEDGIKLIDPADMVRVFSGKNKAPNKPIKTNNVQTAETAQNEHYTKLLEEQLREAKEREQFLKQQIADIRKDYDDFKALAIGMKSPTPAEQKEQSDTEQNTENATMQTGQGGQRNDTEITQQKRGLLSRLFNLD